MTADESATVGECPSCGGTAELVKRFSWVAFVLWLPLAGIPYVLYFVFRKPDLCVGCGMRRRRSLRQKYTHWKIRKGIPDAEIPQARQRKDSRNLTGSNTGDVVLWVALLRTAFGKK